TLAERRQRLRGRHLSANVSTFRGEGVEPDLVPLAVADDVSTFRGRPVPRPVGVAGRRRGWLAGGVFVLAFALAAEGGRGFPVAKRAAADANLGGGSLLGHPLAEQLRRPLLLGGSLLLAAALVG